MYCIKMYQIIKNTHNSLMTYYIDWAEYGNYGMIVFDTTN